MKDEQMKSDLITNVSHDIKTPLTSIINYVDLLKRLKITEEPAKSYIAVLDSKSQRLKQLTDDLVEASKISSGNIVLNLEPLNLTELLNQAVGEVSDRLEEKKLQIIFDGSDVGGMIYADSRRMWRIIENLFQNICKYALEGTRVYLEMKVEGGRVTASLKNISDRPMNLKGEELSERFIRGDASRTTEGSGLGLYIAKNLTQAQHGEFQIQLSGAQNAGDGEAVDPVPEGTGETDTAEADGRIGNDLKAFLKDNTFFDPDVNPILEAAKDNSHRLSLVATSVEKDLRIQIVDNEGVPVTGESFYVRVDGLGDYKDLDQDGVIYIADLDSGDYYMELLPIEGYKVPITETKVHVKEKVEYLAIDDISLLIKTEDEVDSDA